ncbi:hypothetical protein ACXIUS_17535 [Bosea thiooxidans]|nr:hypothetical protein [Bosea sp. (in: a-proteobacteria)]
MPDRLSRAYNTDLPDVPEFERALWDEAVARAMYPQSHKRPVVRDDNLPLTMVDLAQELSLSVKTTHKLACELGFADATSNRSRRLVITRDVVEKIKQVKSRLVDRDRATYLMGIERRCFDALVYNGDIVSIIRYKVGEVTSDRFDSQKIADYVADQCKRLGKNWFNHISKQPQPPKSQSTSSARFRRLPQADGLGINEAASIIRVDRVTALSMVDAGILVALGGVTKSVRLTAESVERARWAYAPAQLYASCLADACDPGVAGKALASKGVPSVPLGPGAKAVVERAAARKALGLSADPDRVEGSLPCLWGVIEEAVRSAGLPFVSTQLPLGSTLILADSSRLARLAFTVVDGESTLVGATASGINFSRRNAILPHIAGNLRKGQQRSSAEFTLDESGTQATLNEFHVRDFANWHRATHFVTEYLTYVRHGLYEARAQLREVGR